MEIEFPHKNAKAYKKDRLFYHFFMLTLLIIKQQGFFPVPPGRSQLLVPLSCAAFSNGGA
jgi:hypothetical protein